MERFYEKKCQNCNKIFSTTDTNFKSFMIDVVFAYAVFPCFISRANKRTTFLIYLICFENFIKRHLNKNETIHHINGIQSDNRIENLFLFKNQKEHFKYHQNKNKNTLISNLK